MRIDGRADDQLRTATIKPGVLAFAEGSALIEMGNTHVLCAVTVEDRVPNYLKGANKGWVTAEYGMLPRSTQQRTPREAREGKQSGRTLEIQRLIGRSLRAVTRLDVLGERTFTVDCDVLQADGGTRTAAITGSYVALYQAFHKLVKQGTLPAIPLRCAVAAVSVGIVDGEELLDLCYEEDYRAQADCNVVMTSDGQFVEVQATAEGEPFSRQRLDALLQRAGAGLTQLFALQETAVRSFT